MTGRPRDSEPDDARLSSGTRFGAYEVVRALGAGAFGSVYEARRLPLGNRFALKVLHPELTASPKIVARFMREAEATAQIRHPHVVSTFEVGVVDRVPFLAMEFLEGETLHARMQREGTLPLQLVADVMVPVCSAVATVHEHQIVHRDLKPENIMLTEPRAGDLHPIVLDFGVARALSGDSLQLTTSARILGTPLYMSPEQLMDPGEVDARSDQWAIGVILYACLSGKFPFMARAIPELMVKIASTSPTPLASRVAGLAPEVDALVMRALQREPSARFASVREIGAALLPYASLKVRASWEAEYASHVTVAPAPPPPLTSTVVSAPLPPPPSPAPSPRRRTGAVWALVAAGALVVAGLVATRLRSPEAPPVVVAPRAVAPPPAVPPPVVPPPVAVAPPVVAAVTVAAPDAGELDAARTGRRAIRTRVVTPARAVVPAVTADPPSVVVGANGAVMR